MHRISRSSAHGYYAPQPEFQPLADHRGDRQAWLLATLGLSATGNLGRYQWEKVAPSDPDYLPPPERLTRVVAERMRWKHALDEARRRAQEAADGPPLSGAPRDG